MLQTTWQPCGNLQANGENREDTCINPESATAVKAVAPSLNPSAHLKHTHRPCGLNVALQC